RHVADLDLCAARHGLPLLGPVLRAALLTVAHARSVERGADHLVADARQVANTPTADEHHGVLLEVVPLAGDVGRDLEPVRQPDTRDLPKRRVRLLRSVREHARADPPLLRGAGEGRALGLALGRAATFSYELVDGGHELPRIGSDTTKVGRRPPANRGPMVAKNAQRPANRATKRFREAIRPIGSAENADYSGDETPPRPPRSAGNGGDHERSEIVRDRR